MVRRTGPFGDLRTGSGTSLRALTAPVTTKRMGPMATYPPRRITMVTVERTWPFGETRIRNSTLLKAPTDRPRTSAFHNQVASQSAPTTTVTGERTPRYATE